MSWKPEVRTGTDPNFYGNALRFSTKLEAEQNASDLMDRWFAVVECRAAASDDPVNYTYHNRQLERIEVQKVTVDDLFDNPKGWMK